MLVALAGRQGSGKTTLANDLLRGGFRRLSFAGRLKRLVAQLYGWDEESLYSEQGKQEPLPREVQWGPVQAEMLGAMIDASRPLRSERREFATRREALQYVGTDVLRQYDDQFHLNSVREAVAAAPRADFVLDDCRFLNELQVMRELDAIPMFVTRPARFQYNNHKSESELRRRHFRYVIVNDRSQPELVRGFQRLLSYAMDEQDIKDRSDETLLAASRDGWSAADHDFLGEAGPEQAYWVGYMMAAGEVCLDRPAGIRVSAPESRLGEMSALAGSLGCGSSVVRVTRQTCTVEVRSPLLVDDLKLWSYGDGARNHGVPFMVGSDGDLMSLWIAGLMDGAGNAVGGPRARFTSSPAVVAAVRGWAGCGGEVTPGDPSGHTESLRYDDDEAAEFWVRLKAASRVANSIRRGNYEG